MRFLSIFISNYVFSTSVEQISIFISICKQLTHKTSMMSCVSLLVLYTLRRDKILLSFGCVVFRVQKETGKLGKP